MTQLPNSRPAMQKEDLLRRLATYSLGKYPVKLVGIRGYFKDTMGKAGQNDIGIYDDALFIVAPDFYKAYNANTDPSRWLPGVAVLKAGGPYLYKIGMHNMKNPYEALRQYGNVTVIRNGKVEVTDSPANRFYIDIHKGGHGTTSSLGCQTIYPDQWPEFLQSVKDQIQKNNQTIIPYLLLEA
jgi:lysozyme